MRDEGWKEFYIEKMDKVPDEELRKETLEVIEAEAKAERHYATGQIDKAIETLDHLRRSTSVTKEENGWYQQEIARMLYHGDRRRSVERQIEAHRLNRSLLRPPEGIIFEKITPLDIRRVDAIKAWVKNFESPEDLIVTVQTLLTHISFGSSAETFERAIDTLGKALGFSTERPDKAWGAGPDNLWCLAEGKYALMEAKSEVDIHRKEIYKEESGQINNSIAWFRKNYPNCESVNAMFIPTKALSKGAGFNEAVLIVRDKSLRRLKNKVRSFFIAIAGVIEGKISNEQIEKYLADYELLIDNFFSTYGELPAPGIG
jgi:hypothetical protein